MNTGILKEHYKNKKSIQIDEEVVCYINEGNGYPVILIHGIPLSSFSWRQVIKKLANNYNTYAIDMPGYGLSSKSNPAYHLTFFADFLFKFMEKTGLEKAHVVGSSFGAGIATTFALQHPEKVNKLVLINSVCYDNRRHSMEKLVRTRLTRGFIRKLLNWRKLGYSIFTSKLMDSYANPGKMEDELAESYYYLLHHNNGVDSYLNTLQLFNEKEFVKIFPKINHKTLILWGDRDKIFPTKFADKVAGIMPDAKVEIMTGLGHLPHEEEPEQISSSIISFLG